MDAAAAGEPDFGQSTPLLVIRSGEFVRTVDPGRLTFTSTLLYLPLGLPFDVW